MTTFNAPAQPLLLNDVFANAFFLYRKRFLMFFAIVAIVQIPMIAVKLLLLLTLGQGLPDDTSLLIGTLLMQSFSEGISSTLPLDRLALFLVASLIVGLLQTTFASQILGGVLTNMLLRNHLNQPLSLASAYRLGWRKLLALFAAGAATMLLGLALAGAGLLACWWVGNTVVAGDLRTLRDPNTAALFGITLLAIAALSASIVVAVLIRCIFFPQAIVVESIGAFQGLRRSWTLVGSAFWRVLGSVALVWMLIMIATGIPTACINFIVQFLFPHPVEDLVVRQVASLFVSEIAYIAALPIQLSAYVMLYFDLRRRMEGHAAHFE